MLGQTLSEDQTAGAHLQRPATGAGWVFLLPSLARHTVVCVGRPTTTAEAMLERISNRLVIIDNLDGLEAQLGDLTSDGESAVDLVAVCSTRVARRLWTNTSLRSTLQASLAPRAVVYEEHWGHASAGRWASALAVHGGTSVAWLTPAFGDVRTAAAGFGSAPGTWLRTNGLDRPSIDHRSLLRWRRAYRARVGSAVVPSVRSPDVGSGARGDAAARPGMARARQALVATTRGVGRIEPFVAARSSHVRRIGVLSGPDVNGTLPRYVLEMAGAAGIDLKSHGWAALVPGGYEAQKVLLFAFAPGTPAPQLIVKVARSERSSLRLERGVAGLRRLTQWPDLSEGTVAKVAFSGREGGLAVVGESVVEGVPLSDQTSATAHCPLIAAAVAWLSRVGVQTAQPVAGATAGVAMTEIVDRLERSYCMSGPHLEFLRVQSDRVAAAAELPGVFAHGDPGVWNVIARADGGVACLDWEYAEPSSPPLWGLLYLLRSYAVLSGRQAGGDRVWAAASPFVETKALHPLLRSSIHAYCDDVGVPSSLVGPLFYLCWAMHAVKEGARLSLADRERGRHVSFLRLMIEEDQNPVLRGIFEPGPC